MFKQSYKQINHFDFFLLIVVIIDYLNKRDLPAKFKTHPDIPFVITSMINNYGCKVRNEIKLFERQAVNASNILTNYLKYDILLKDLLNQKDKELLSKHNIVYSHTRFKYSITTKAIKLVELFNNSETLPLFSLYGMPPSLINVLCTFITEDSDLTEDEILSVLKKNNIFIHENMSCYTAINKLATKKLINKKLRDEEKTKYHITDLGRSVLNLILDMDEALNTDEETERKTFQIDTPYKTILAFPLWV